MCLCFSVRGLYGYYDGSYPRVVGGDATDFYREIRELFDGIDPVVGDEWGVWSSVTVKNPVMMDWFLFGERSVALMVKLYLPIWMVVKRYSYWLFPLGVMVVLT